MSRGRWAGRAAGEFAVIVAGVLVALTLESWWQSREDRRQEATYLDGVVAELASYADAIQASLDNSSGVHGELESARALLGARQHLDRPADFISSLVVAMTWLPITAVSTPIYDDLVSTGNIRLIHDPELRNSVLDAYSSLEMNVERLDLARESISPGLDALVSGHLPPNVVSRGASPRDIRVSSDEADLTALRVASERIVSDPRFERELNAEYRRIERFRQQLSRHHELAQEHLAEVRDGLARARGST